MILKRCFVENFGTLHDFKYDFEKGLNIIQQENGWGKSTLSVFIKSMFYGLPVSRKILLDENERKKYTPWQGGNFGGYIEFEIDDKAYRIERFFGKKENEDTFTLYDLTTNKKSSDYSSKIGYEIFKIDEDAYERSTYFPQKSYKLGINDSIKAKLTNLIENADDMGGFSKGIESLKVKKGIYEKRGNKGLIVDLENRQHDLNNSLETCQEKESRKNQLAEQCSKKQKEKKELENQASKLASEIDVVKDNRVKKEIYDTYQRLKTDYQRANSAYNSVKSNFDKRPLSSATMQDLEERMFSINNASYRIKEFYQQKDETIEVQKKTASNAKLFGWVLGVVGLLLLGGGIGALFINPLIGYILLGAFGALMVASIITILTLMLNKSSKQKAVKLEEEVEQASRQVENNSYYITNTLKSYDSTVNQNNYYERYNELKYNSRLIKDKEEEKDQKQKALSEYIKAKNIDEKNIPDTANLITDYEPLEIQLNQVKIRDDEVKIEIINLNNEIKQCEVFIRQKDEILKDIDDNQAAIEKAKYNVQIISLAMEFLESSREALSKNYLSKMESSCSKYIRQFNHTDDFSIDTDLDVKIEKNGEKKDLSYFSAGHKDIVGLCTRLALIDAMFENEKPFIVFDDPFVNFDDSNLESAKEILAEIAKTYQIVYLVCHSSRAK